MRGAIHIRLLVAGLLLWASGPAQALVSVRAVSIPRVGSALVKPVALSTGLRGTPLGTKLSFHALPTPVAFKSLSLSLSPVPAAKQEAGRKLQTRLEGLFDGRRELESGDLLERAEATGVTHAAVAGEIKSSRNLLEAVMKLKALGLIKAGEVDSKSLREQKSTLTYLINRLWAKTAATQRFVEDRSYPVPAVLVEKDGVAYYVHGVFHGKHFPNAKRSVLKTAAMLKKDGKELYAEQNFGAGYGFDYGQEFVDHEATDGVKARLRPQPKQTVLDALNRGVVPALIRAAWLTPLAVLLNDPSTAWAWALAPFAMALDWLRARGFLPTIAWSFQRSAREAESLPDRDMADYFRAKAELFASRKPDLTKVRAVELPLPLMESVNPFPEDSRRSKAMAEAAAADAKTKGLKEVHLLVGLNHVFEIADHLAAQGPSR